MSDRRTEIVGVLSGGRRLRRLTLAISVMSLLSFTGGRPLDAITITVVGSWSKTVGAADLIAGAGSDLTSTYESGANQGVMSIGSPIGSWRVDVKKLDTVWDTDLHLDVRRTSDGTGLGSISGGTTYIEITGVDTTFFSGDDDRSDVDLQLRISGVSVSLGVSNFSTTITYTVVDV